MKYKIILVLLFLSTVLTSWAQNKQVDVDAVMVEGEKLFKQNKFEGARKQYEQATTGARDNTELAKIQHNIGNTYAAQNDWQNAVNSYKSALRKNPNDRDTKYNLSLALKKLKEQQDQKDKNKDDTDKKNEEEKKEEQKNKEDKKDDKKDKPKEEQKDPKKEEKPKDKEEEKNGKGDKNKQEKEESKPIPANNKLTEQRAAEMLNAIQQAEQKVQERRGEKTKGAPSKLDKDW